MHFLKQRLDGLNHAELKLPGVRPSLLDLGVVEIRARHNVASLHKGSNNAPSNLNGPHPMPLAVWAREELWPVTRSRVRIRTRLGLK